MQLQAVYIYESVLYKENAFYDYFFLFQNLCYKKSTTFNSSTEVDKFSAVYLSDLNAYNNDCFNVIAGNVHRT